MSKNVINKNLIESKVSRRVFLSGTGKLITLGALSHFALIGAENVDSYDSTTCGADNPHKCTTTSPNSCQPPSLKCSPSINFSCSGGITCTAPVQYLPND